jgi:hypothetical protein
MKKLILFLAIAVSTSALAQSTEKEDVDIVQAVYGKSKKDLVASYMNIQGVNADAFWKTYDEYEVARKTLGQTKIQIINDYGANYSTLTDEKADQLAKAAMKNNMDYEKLFSKYYDKNKKIIGAIQAAKWIQLEVYLQTVIRGEIQDAIPFIGQLEKSKTN